MNAAQSIDIPRLIRIATLAFALLGGALVYFSYAPTVNGLQQRIDDSEETLRSDEVAFAEMPHVRSERDELARRYASLFAQSAEAVFLRELGETVRRHGVTLLTTSVSRDTLVPGPAVRTTLLAPTRMQIELRGSYARVLLAIEDLSLGSEIVEVQAPSLRRDGDAVIASIPVAIYEPQSEAPASVPAK